MTSPRGGASSGNRFAPVVPFVACFLLVMLVATLGCGPGGPKTYPVRGKIEIPGGGIEHLAGSTIEAALVSDPTVRASGTIQADGSFQLETLHAGVILPGAQAGKHEIRIILSDDDRAARRKAAKSLAPRYLDFKKSGLEIDVPPAGPVSLPLAPR